MNAFKYETHLHTAQASKCASSLGREYIKAFNDIGYTGIFVTDHFFGGNTAVPFDADWETRINQYCSGYEDALAEAEKFNRANGLLGTEKEFKVFFGIEQTFDGDDYLIYGLDKKWLINHPEFETMRHKEVFAEVNKVNGLMIQAHPFRLRDYIQAIHIHPRDIHGIEIYNAGNQPVENELAEFYAKKYDFPLTSGSDIHRISFIPDAPGKLPLGGMIFETPLKDIFDYAERIKKKQGTLIK